MQCVFAGQDGVILQRASGREAGLRALAMQRDWQIVPITPDQYDAMPPIEQAFRVVNGALVALEVAGG